MALPPNPNVSFINIQQRVVLLRSADGRDDGKFAFAP
jgi:hypothetical protein